MSDDIQKTTPTVRARLPLGRFAYYLGPVFALLSVIIGFLGVGALGFWIYLALQSTTGSTAFDPYTGVLGLAVVLLLSAGFLRFAYEEVPE